MSNALPTRIAILAASGLPGRYVCPKCNGGSDAESSLSLRFDVAGGVHWRCFRALCGYTGGPRGVRNAFATIKREPRYMTRPTCYLRNEQREIVDSLFGLDAIDLGILYTEQDDRFILPVEGPRRKRRGCIAYSLSGAKPKSLTYNEKPEEPFIHHATSKGRENIVIVEDWFSAEKVAATGLATGAAIMGTHLTQADVSELVATAAQFGAKTWLALDKDAYAKSIGYLHRYREQFPGGLWVWSLDRDLKYETTERITEALTNGKINFSRDVSTTEKL